MTPTASPNPDRGRPRALSWAASATPAVTADGRRWQLSGHLQLSAMRRDARGLLGSSVGPGPWNDAQDEAIERAVLALDELASNALRHGRSPISAELFDRGETWLIVVTDGATAELPVPAVGRPGDLGGFGLYVVADLAVAHGIDVRGDHKCVWAELPKG
ncbi:ATP-binding protein [Blastococcus sp. CT_GayMR16]|uniref:ATP-binding protein n=1 Tax=Blastococcus sp. CT_GayMR16 TaxID=2559607 RepID=UPI0010740B0B|nr:ATP-binding protein [Blastococcus sp. CT_GayMR16]TFV89604.1 ATP-binding protein [Blastococcus sp. CT_GayMR16]